MTTSGCPTPGKNGYETKRHAKRSLSRMRGLTDRESFHAYRCGCGLFHLGHKPGSRKNRHPLPRLSA